MVDNTVKYKEPLKYILQTDELYCIWVRFQLSLKKKVTFTACCVKLETLSVAGEKCKDA